MGKGHQPPTTNQPLLSSHQSPTTNTQQTTPSVSPQTVWFVFYRMILRTFLTAIGWFLLRHRLKSTLLKHLLPPCVLSGEAQSVVENIGFQALDSTATATVRVVVTLDCPDSNEKKHFLSFDAILLFKRCAENHTRTGKPNQAWFTFKQVGLADRIYTRPFHALHEHRTFVSLPRLALRAYTSRCKHKTGCQTWMTFGRTSTNQIGCCFFYFLRGITLAY